MKPSGFYFPTDIRLRSTPLVEAWLDMRWQLEPVENQPDLLRDPGFLFALGTFYKSIKDRFGHREDLPQSNAPLEFLPHVVRHRFRQSPESWPLLQLGPGVATVNFTQSYSWQAFRDVAQYMRERLIRAYDTELKPLLISLQYRNAVPCEYSSGQLVEFIKHNLNTNISFPAHIPGHVGVLAVPVDANIVLEFDLRLPKGRGTLQFITGTKREIEQNSQQEITSEHVLFELRVASRGADSPDYSDETQFLHWLDSAHAVIHEWFFSLIDGSLRHKYEMGEE